MKKEYISPELLLQRISFREDILSGSVENPGSQVNPGGFDEPIFDDDDEGVW